MTEQHSDMRSKKTEAPASSAPAPLSVKDRKKRILWLAVGGMTAIIVLFWILLLPLQIRELKFGTMSDLTDRWRVFRDENQPPASFRETLNKLHDRLVESSAKDQAAAVLTAPTTAAPSIDIIQLREKLEQVSENTLNAPANAASKTQGTK